MAHALKAEPLLGMLNASWPFATFELEPARIRLRVLGITYDFRREDVQRLDYYEGWYSCGVRIVHTSQNGSSQAIFWSFYPNRVLSAADSMGYEIKAEDEA